MEKVCRRRKIKISAEPSNMYLILPSYAEQHKAEIKMIIANEKAKLCRNAFSKNIFFNVEFKIAFANSRNIKKMIVSSKI